jgi:hypothetical protein
VTPVRRFAAVRLPAALEVLMTAAAFLTVLATVLGIGPFAGGGWSG